MRGSASSARAAAARAIGVVAALALLPAAAAAQDNVALVYRLLLEQQMVVNRNAQSLQATLGQRLTSGDLVLTSANTRAAIRFTDDGSIVRLNPNSQLSVRTEGARGSATKTLQLDFGELWAKVAPQNGRTFQVQTPSGVAAVKGTEFVVRVDQNGVTTVLTFEGAVDFFNGAGTVSVESGKQSQAADQNTLAVLTDITDQDKKALETLTAAAADDDVIRVEIPVQNADGVQKTLILEVPRKEAEPIVNPGGGK